MLPKVYDWGCSETPDLCNHPANVLLMEPVEVPVTTGYGGSHVTKARLYTVLRSCRGLASFVTC